jgi:hypothetical protein
MLRHYATSPKLEGSIPDEVYCLGVDSTSIRNEYQESSWGLRGGWRVRLTIFAIYEPIV